MKITIQGLTKSFGTTAVLKGVSLEVADSELFFLLGPSGCGKTTLLRILAGFHRPDAGELLFGARRMDEVPPHQRNVGMVFQNFALWPHMTVGQNVAYGLDVRGVDSAEKKHRVQEALETVRMVGLSDRTPDQLSGGQQQRVALARALVIRPDVLLLDEPLSNLDARLRSELRDEIRRIHGETRITTLYVTHDQEEALSLADRMAVMRDGRVEQTGDPRSVYRRPVNRFVADTLGETNWVEGEVETATEQGLVVRSRLGRFDVLPKPGLIPGAAVWLGARPGSVRIGPATGNAFACRLRQVSFLGGAEALVLSAADGVSVKATVPSLSGVPAIGTDLVASVRPEDLLVLPR